MTNSTEPGLLDPAVQQCPFPFYAALRSDDPVFHDTRTGMWLVTRYDDVVEACRQPDVFSNRFGTTSLPPDADLAAALEGVQATGYPSPATLLTADPPDHTRYRSLVNKAFTPKAVARLRPRMREIADGLIDTFAATGHVEIVSQFGVGLPLIVIADSLGVPRADLVDFKRWSDDSVAAIGTDLTRERRLEAAGGVVEYQHYFAGRIASRRQALESGGDLPDDILTALIRARLDGPAGEPAAMLSVPEMLSILQQLLVAGNETTTKLIAEAVLLVCRHPDALDAVRAEPALAADVVEEALRLSTPTQAMFRIATVDTQLSGVAIPAGARVLLVYASANRDELRFTAPDSFDPGRDNLKQHLAFGSGIHFCLGAPLARAEGQVALEALTERLSGLHLAASNTFEVDPSFMLRGLRALHLDFEPVR